MKRIAIAFTVLMVSLNVPCLARHQIASNQAQGSESHAKELSLQAKLQAQSESGVLDADSLSQYQRRLEELQAKEQELRSRGAYNDAAKSDLAKELNELETDMNQQIKDALNPKPKKDQD